jgi:hypothetical protein
LSASAIVAAVVIVGKCAAEAARKDVQLGVKLREGDTFRRGRQAQAAVVEALADPAFRDRLSGLGVEIPAREQQTPAALRVHLKDEIDKWRPIIESANIKPE